MAEAKRFLVVDDERHIVRLLKVNLERNGCEVSTAFTGDDAIALLKAQSFDRAILDYGMPTPNGYDILEFIRTNESIAGTTVWLMTQNEQETDELRNRPYQADRYSHPPERPSWFDRFK